MTAAPARPVRAHPAARTDPRLDVLLADLTQLGVHARVLTEWVAGERDVRLQAWRDGGEVTVELLWCAPDAPPRGPAEAVRVVGDRREVWRSLHGHSGEADIIRFLCDLLLLTEDTLTSRHLRLG